MKKRTLLASMTTLTTTLTLLLAGCAVSSPAPDATTPATPPPAPTQTATPPAPTQTSTPDVSAEADVDALKDAWTDASPEQQQWALDQVAGLPDDQAADLIVERAAELGFTVTPETADEVLAWLASQR